MLNKAFKIQAKSRPTAGLITHIDKETFSLKKNKQKIDN